jgi:SAM-dependent methyltransferase
MSERDKNYFIRRGYRANLANTSFDCGSDPDYWNQERLRDAARNQYQYGVYALAAELVRKRKIGILLDVGCGAPLKLKELMPATGLEIHLVDQTNTASIAAEILPRANFTAANLESVNIELGRQFPLIICADVIEHLLDPDACLTFIRRHLTPNGLLYISTPDRNALRGNQCQHSPHPMHVREWCLTEFRAYLESRGFSVLKQQRLPNMKIGQIRGILGSLLNSLGSPPNWYSCQLAVCRQKPLPINHA